MRDVPGHIWCILGARFSGDLADCTTGELAAILAFLRAARQLADEETARIRNQGIRQATRRSRGLTAAPPATAAAT